MKYCGHRNWIPFIIVIILIIYSSKVTAQQFGWGMGFKFGDPTGASIKKYFDGRSLELIAGRMYFFSGKNTFEKRYQEWYESQGFNYKQNQFDRTETTKAIGIQIHWLYQQGLTDFLEWYYGVGGQLSSRKYSYIYMYKGQTGPWETGKSDEITDLDLGIDGVFGLEYTIENSPITIFSDLVLFLELHDVAFRFRVQGGAGARVNF